jgi:hypothetical protein
MRTHKDIYLAGMAAIYLMAFSSLYPQLQVIYCLLLAPVTERACCRLVVSSQPKQPSPISKRGMVFKKVYSM